jgi:hypothetical protein
MAATSSQAAQQAELEAELRQAEADFVNGDYLELTPEQLEHCIRTGESPWSDESRG